MNSFNTGINLAPDSSFLQELEKATSEPTGAFSPPSMSGHSVQRLKSHLPVYVKQSDEVKNNANYVNQLTQYAVAPFTLESDFISDLVFFDIQPEELDVYLGTNETESDALIFTELHPYNVTHPPLQESYYGETSVNFSQPSSRPVTIIDPLDKNTQQQVQIEIASTVSINSGNVVNSLKRPFPECKYFEARPQKSAKKSSSTISENRFEAARFKLTKPSGSSEYVPIRLPALQLNIERVMKGGNFCKKELSESVIQDSEFNTSMNRLDVDTNFVTRLSYSQELQEAPLSTTVASSSHMSRSGHFVQIHDLRDSGQLNQQVKNQNSPGSRLLNSFSISHLPPTENKLALQESYSQEDIVLPCDFTCEHFDDDFTFTDLTSIYSQQIAQQYPPEHSSVTFSQPSSLPAVTVGPLKKDTQLQVITLKVQFKATESSGSGKPMPLTLEEEECVSGTGKVSKAKYEASDECKASKAKYNAFDKGKETRAKYYTSDAGKAARARYNASDKCKAARAKYNASVKGKAKQAVRSARSHAYRKAKNQGLSEALAREKGELAASAKQVELSSQFPTLFSRQTAENYNPDRPPE